MMRQAKLCVVLLALVLGGYGLPGPGFCADYTRPTEDFGVLGPGDRAQFKVTPPKNAKGDNAIVTKGYYDNPDALWKGSLADWYSTITPDYPSSHSGYFHGEYGYPGTGTTGRALTWEATTKLVVPKVIIENYTSVTYDGLNSSGSLNCRIEPSDLTPSSYSWVAGWKTPAYNNPQVQFANPSCESTRILNAHWYSTTPPPGARVAVFYDIYCKVRVNGATCSNTVPATFCVDVYQEGGHCDPPSHKKTVSYGYQDNGGYFTVTSVDDWERIAPVISNAYSINSQFYWKVQAHESKHKSDFDSGYNGRLFYQKSEFEPLIIGLTNSTLEGLDAMVSEKLNQYCDSEVAEIDAVHDEMEDRAYQVSDAVPPFYVYQKGGLKL